MCTRRVSASGATKIDQVQFFLSSSLAGWSIGLKPIAQDLMEVWFGRLLLGQVDLTANEAEKV
jgi:hypothetical protein